MILQKEIATIAEQTGVTKTVIEKDWVLGHFISALYSEPEIKQNLVFKGGTCLRKCWYPDYRFSEDLDFTSQTDVFELTEPILKKVCEKIEMHTGIRTHIHTREPIVFQNRRVGQKVIVKYWGADHPKNEVPPPQGRWQTKIKIEIISYEQILFKTIKKSLFHPYSDYLLSSAKVPCYRMEEVLSEKIRALIQRSYTAPRDFYDIWYLSNNVPDLNWSSIVQAFQKKMKFKGLKFTGMEQFINPKVEKVVRQAWKNSLAHQVRPEQLPQFDTVKEYLIALFKQKFIS